MLSHRKSLRRTLLGFAGLFVAGYFVAAGSFVYEDAGPALVPGAAQIPEDRHNRPSELIIGEWEDTLGSWIQRIRIVEWHGNLCREVHYPDGNFDRDFIEELAPEATEMRRFTNPSSQTSQIYAITRHGHLAIYDADGFVAMAINVTTKREVQ